MRSPGTEELVISVGESMIVMIPIMSMTMTMMWVFGMGNRFTFFWSPMNITVSEMMIITVFVIVWLHLENQVSTMDENLRSAERSAVMIKSGVFTLMPLFIIKCIKVVFPVEIKSVCFVVICVGFNIVINAVPWHINRVESVAP